MTMYVITHKEISTTLPTGYTPLLVGANSNKLPDNLTYLKDNTGENISSKNPNYCELTGLYWIWKNSTAKNVGICHYRRFFTKDNVSTKLRRTILSLIEKTRPLNVTVLDQELMTYDIILPTKEDCKYNNLLENYAIEHYASDLDTVRDVIKKIHPEYLDTFDETLQQKYMSMYNMLYTRKEIFDDYCSWLFEILFETEIYCDLSNYDSYQARIYGFLAERLLNVWINYNNHLNIKYIDVYNSELLTRKRIQNQITDAFKK